MQGLWERIVRLTHSAGQPYDRLWTPLVHFWMQLGPTPEQHMFAIGDEQIQAGESAIPA